MALALPPPPGDRDSSYRPVPPGNRPQQPAPGAEKALLGTVARHKCARASPRSGQPDSGLLSGGFGKKGSRNSCPAIGAQGAFLLRLCPALQGEARPSGPVLRAGVSPPTRRASGFLWAGFGVHQTTPATRQRLPTRSPGKLSETEFEAMSHSHHITNTQQSREVEAAPVRDIRSRPSPALRKAPPGSTGPMTGWRGRAYTSAQGYTRLTSCHMRSYCPHLQHLPPSCPSEGRPSHLQPACSWTEPSTAPQSTPKTHHHIFPGYWLNPHPQA